MKKIQKISIISLLMLIVIFSSANAQGNLDWEKSAHELTGEEIYSLSFSGLDCSILLKENGMIRIIAKDSNYYGKLVSQCILLKDGDLKFEGLSIQDNEKSWICKSNGGYSVFQEKFLPYAEKLPPEVKEKFNGYFGVK